MRIFPAVHYTMGGLWVDYNLMSTVPGLFVLGEANFSDHGANRLGASALMQGLADGYFVIPYTLANYIASNKFSKVDENVDAAKAARNDVQKGLDKILNVKGSKSVDYFHKKLEKSCGTNAVWREMKRVLLLRLMTSKKFVKSFGTMSGYWAQMQNSTKNLKRLAV